MKREETAREMPMKPKGRHENGASNWILNEYVHFANLIVLPLFFDTSTKMSLEEEKLQTTKIELCVRKTDAWGIRMGKHADAAHSKPNVMLTKLVKQLERAVLIASPYQMPFLAITLSLETST